MAASPVISAPPISPGEMQLLLSRAGLVLNPGQVADLVLAWRQVAGLIASITQDRPLADDAAYSFHLPLPAGAVAANPARAPVPAKSPAAPKSAVKARSTPKAKAAAPRARPAAKPKARVKAQPKAVPKRKAAKPAGRKPARRGR
jgi:pyruvate/2-oxoglutarate dehydrogenase complex dihydrolipoamide acyltransferase (E2) component